MNAAELSKSSNETLKHHVTNITSPAPPTRLPVPSAAPAHASSVTLSVMTSHADDIVSQVRHRKVPLHYDDVNIPSDSYFTGDEEVPVWNVPDLLALLDTAARDDDHQLSVGQTPYITANGSTDSRQSRDVISLHKLVTSSDVANAGYHDDGQVSSRQTSYKSTTQLKAYAPLTTLSTESQSISRLFPTTTTTTAATTQQSTSHQSTPSRHQGHQHDVTTTTSTAAHDVGNYSSPSDGVVSTPRHVLQTASTTSSPQRRAAAAAPRSGAGPPVGTRRLGGFGPDYFDFFDYIVDYQTRRPPRKRVHVKARRKTKRAKSRRVKHGPSPDTIYTWPTERGVDQRDVAGRQRLTQSVPGWIVRDQPQHQHGSMKIHGTSALHLASTVNHNTAGGRFLKEGKDTETVMDRPVSTVYGYDQLHGIIYTSSQTNQNVTSSRDSRTNQDVTSSQDSQTNQNVTSSRHSRTNQDVTSSQDSQTNQNVTSSRHSQTKQNLTSSRDSRTNQNVTSSRDSRTNQDVPPRRDQHLPQNMHPAP